jgi:CHAT domain-containing protein
MSKFFHLRLIFILPSLAILSATALASPNEVEYQKALRYLKYRQVQSACITLTLSLNFDRSVCKGQDSEIFKQKIASIDQSQNNSLSLLGIVFRHLGYYDLAHETLEAAQFRAITPEEKDSISLSLGNISQSNYQRLLMQYNNSDKKDKKDEAVELLILEAKTSLDQYQHLWTSKIDSIGIKSQLNWLILISSFTKEFPELLKLKSQTQVNEILQNVSSQITRLPEQEQVLSRLKYAEAIRKLANDNDTFLAKSLEETNTAIKLSSQSKDPILSSQALGLAGKIFLQTSDLPKAESYFLQAQNLALAHHSLELAYQWQWELGKIYVKTGDARAIPQYREAVGSLNSLRKNLITINPDLQFGFQEQVEPLYKEFLVLLFKQSQPDLKEIIKVNEVVQVTELENYLQCSQLQVNSILNLTQKDSPDAVIYMIRLPSSYELIVRLKDGNLIHRTAKFSAVEAALDKIRQNLTSEQLDNLDSGGFRALFGELYQSLFKPIENVLPTGGTIVFSGDSQLLSIPWGILYDGSQYLIERYSIAYSLGVDTQPAKTLNTGNMRVFGAGISDLSGKSNFEDLAFVPEELQGIKDTVPRSETLLNQQFTTDRLLKSTANFSVIHLATHGQFSSNPNESYILGWDSKIFLKEIRNLVRKEDSHNSPSLELLVLSACESAKGDKRAALGLAGTAIEAGARSTIASQWVINDRSQANLMKRFYQDLMKGKPKAEALRDAQLSILNSKVLGDKFANPYYWGMNILVGSWL